MSPSSSTMATTSSSVNISSVAVQCLPDGRVLAFVCALTLCLGVGDPGGDHGRVRAGVEGCPVPGQLGVACGYGQAFWTEWWGRGIGGCLLDELGDRVSALQRAELLDQPGVERPDEVVLAQGHVRGWSRLLARAYSCGQRRSRADLDAGRGWRGDQGLERGPGRDQ